MANPKTTHVIEIATGIGEPAFIPLSMGTELQPISVGKKGMWRIESSRVLDVHAFVYFDGNALFLQSSDESNAASVDGFRVGKAWTELHAPCTIEVGAARLRYRSLLAEDNQATDPVPPPAPVPPTPASSPTLQRPLTNPPGGAPLTFPKADRPFKPGEFGGQPPTSESTRVKPLDATGASGRPRMPSGSHPRTVPDDHPTTRRNSGSSPALGAVGSGQFRAQQQQQQQGAPSAPGSNPQGHGAMPPGYPTQPGYPEPGYPTQPGGYAGAYGSLPPGTMPPMPGPPGMPPPGLLGPGSSPGGFGSTTPQGGLQKPGSSFIEKLKQQSIPKMVAGVLFIIGGIIYLAEDPDPDTSKKSTSSAEAGAEGGKAATTPPTVAPANTAPSWPAGVACPPPNWPPNTPLPCTPTASSLPDKPDKPDKKDGGAHAAAGTKTLERQAVDFVSTGENAKAAGAYEELVRRDPNNKVYAEAARILRAKLDAGSAQ